MVSGRSIEEVSKQAIARIGNPPHREPPPWLHAQFVPDCDECQKWHEKFKTVFPQEMKLYLEEQSKVWKVRYKGIVALRLVYILAWKTLAFPKKS